MHLISLLIFLLLFFSLTGRSAQPPPECLRPGVPAHISKQDSRPRNAVLFSSIPDPPSPDRHLENAEARPAQSAVERTARLLAHAVVRDLVCAAVIDHLAAGDRPAPADKVVVPVSLAERRPSAFGPSVSAAVSASARPRRASLREKSAGSDPDAIMMRLVDHLQPELTPGVRRLHRDDPNLFAQLTEKLQSRYPADLSPMNEQGKKIAGILDQAFAESEVERGYDDTARSRELLQEFGREEIRSWAKTYADSYLADLVPEIPEPELLANFVIEAPPDAFAGRLVAEDDEDLEETGCNP